MNHDRRKFLKILALVGGVGLYTKFFGADTINLITGRSGSDSRESGQFRIEEDNGSLNIYSKGGESLFVIDNER